tara:strand:- start:881 stop:1144 length:264 start_codon:yes stop_codon:yes gene_type:complete
MRTTITHSQRRQIARDLLNDRDFCHQVLLNAIAHNLIQDGDSSAQAMANANDISDRLITVGHSLDSHDNAYRLGAYANDFVVSFSQY